MLNLKVDFRTGKLNLMVVKTFLFRKPTKINKFSKIRDTSTAEAEFG